LFSIGNETIWELSYIGSKVQDVIEEDKGYGILSYNIADCLIYEQPQNMIQALGYTMICLKEYKRIISFEMQEKNYKLFVDVKPYFENEEGSLVVCGEKYWEKDEIKKDFKDIKQARVEIIAKCPTEVYKEVLSIFLKIVLKLRKFIKFETTVTDDFIHRE